MYWTLVIETNIPSRVPSINTTCAVELVLLTEHQANLSQYHYLMVEHRDI